jgi:signal peptidase I
MSEDGKLKKRAKRDLDEFKLILRNARRAKKALDAEKLEEVDRRAKAVAAALKAKDCERLGPEVEALEEYIEAHLIPFRPNPYWETAKALLVAVLIAVAIRWFLIEPFRIPSGSMIPTLLIGDQLMVNKLTFGPDYFTIKLNPDLSEAGLTEIQKTGAVRWQLRLGGNTVGVMAKKIWLRRVPQRGEIVVFRWPRDPSQDYIKRVVGVPGDVLEIRDGRLFLNGQEQKESVEGPYKGPVSSVGCADPTLFKEELTRGPNQTYAHDLLHCKYGGPSPDNFGPVTVAPGFLFGMGDNRDTSADSRSWGLIPISHLKGTALFIHLPLNPDNHYLPRWGRFFKGIH